MAETVADLIVRLGLDASKYEKGLRRAERNLKAAGKKMTDVGKKMTTGLTLPLLAAGTAALKMSSDFETSMTKINTLVGVSADQVEAWRDDILALGPAVGKGPKELADAMFFITSAGLRGEKALNTLEIAAKASAVGLGETEVVADALTSAMNAYADSGLTASDATEVLLETVKFGKLEADQLAASIGNVIPIASSLGVAFDEVGAFMASFSLGGATAGQAATALKGAFNAIIRPSQQAAKALEGTAFEGDRLKDSLDERGLIGTLVALRAHYGDNITGLRELFQETETFNAVLAVTKSGGAETTAILEKMRAETGALAEGFAKVTETTGFKFNQLMAQIKVALVQLGDQLAPTIRKAVDAIIPMVKGVGDLVSGFTDLSPGLQFAIIAMTGIAIAAGPVLLVAGQMVIAFGALTGVAGSASIAIGSTAVSATVAAPAMSALTASLTGVSASSAIAAPAVASVTTATSALAIAGITLLGLGIGVAIGTWARSVGGVGEEMDTIADEFFGVERAANGVIVAVDSMTKHTDEEKQALADFIETQKEAIEASEKMREEKIAAGDIFVEVTTTLSDLEQAQKDAADAAAKYTAALNKEGAGAVKLSSILKDLSLANIAANAPMDLGVDLAKGLSDSLGELSTSLSFAESAYAETNDVSWAFMLNTGLGIKKLKGTVPAARSAASGIDAFTKALAVGADFSSIFGDKLGGIFGGLSSAISGGAGLLSGGFSGFKSMFQGAVGPAGEAGKTTFLSFLGGMSSALPMIGSFIGPAMKIIGSLFKPKWKKIGKEGAVLFGKEFSEELSKQLEVDEKVFGSLQNAISANIGDVIKDVGITTDNAGEIMKQFSFALGMVENGSLSVADASEQMNSGFEQIVAHLETMGVEGSFQIGELAQQMSKLGLNTEFLKKKSQEALSALTPFLDHLLKQFKELAFGEGGAAIKAAESNLGVLVATFAAAVQAAGGLGGAIALLPESFDELMRKFEELLGAESEAFNQLSLYYNFAKENSEQLMAIEQLALGFVALMEAGLITKETIGGFGDAFLVQIEQLLGPLADLTDLTMDQKLALISIGPQIGILLEAYKRLGLDPPKWLADLVEKAEEAGASLEPPEGIIDVMKDIRLAILGLVDALKEAFGISEKLNTSLGSGTGTSGRGSGNGDSTDGDPFKIQEGIDFTATQPTFLQVGEGGEPEDVTVQPHFRQGQGSSGGGGMTEITLMIDGTAFGQVTADLSKSGELRIHESAVRTF